MFSTTRKEIKIEKWLKRLDVFLGAKWDELGIGGLIRLSLTPMAINPEVCITLIACWNLGLNCFYFLEGPLSITIDDVFFLTGCFTFGKSLRLYWVTPFYLISTIS